MLEHPSIRHYRSFGTHKSPSDRGVPDMACGDNVTGADNQQETVSTGSSETVRRASLAKEMMRQSDPHGDMGRATEMIVPPLKLHSSGGNRLPKVVEPSCCAGKSAAPPSGDAGECSRLNAGKPGVSIRYSSFLSHLVSRIL
jgi:hypothetical protein